MTVRVEGMGFFKFCAVARATTTNRFYDSVSAESSSIHASIGNPFVPSESAKKSKIEPSMRDEKILENRNIKMLLKLKNFSQNGERMYKKVIKFVAKLDEETKRTTTMPKMIIENYHASLLIMFAL
jgi:hypothetical protein